MLATHWGSVQGMAGTGGPDPTSANKAKVGCRGWLVEGKNTGLARARPLSRGLDWATGCLNIVDPLVVGEIGQ